MTSHGLDKVLSTLLRLLMVQLTNPRHTPVVFSSPINIIEFIFHSLSQPFVAHTQFPSGFHCHLSSHNSSKKTAFASIHYSHFRIFLLGCYHFSPCVT
ncbi:hypothetical protein RchiOBHm_Chr4g0429051 [Rosa chinensis]|uniref:Uncharacterized protein n=1 Tax=Rosa chinensis TaxID=74649 RepID=A0A2P6R079_ROSCH|nr:hypothetical protein RchiOBHm_Chr4g0429051 [Rosa chinensis]